MVGSNDTKGVRAETAAERAALVIHSQETVPNSLREFLRRMEGMLAHVSVEDERPAIIVDLDETLISNMYHVRSADGTWSVGEAAFGVSPDARLSPAYPCGQEVMHRLAARGVAIFYVTGRIATREMRQITKEELADFPEGAVVMREDPNMSSAKCKSIARRKLQLRGHRLLAAIGDQAGDLGPEAELNWAVPNPFYVVD